MIRKSKLKWKDRPRVRAVLAAPGVQKATRSVKSIFFTILRIIIMIASILLIIAFFRWAGLKGMASFILGMSLMGYLLLSKNMMFQGIISMFGADEYLNEISKKK